jgi:hypothetical protein
MYLFQASAGPYASGNPAATLLGRRAEILGKVEPVLKYQVDTVEEMAAPGPLTIDGYLDKRISGDKGQINWFKRKATYYATTQRRLNTAMFLLAVAWGSQVSRGSAGLWPLGGSHHNRERSNWFVRVGATLRATRH